MSEQRRQKITFRATKIVSKPARVDFYTKNGQHVEFKAKENVPKSVRVEFFAKRGGKKK